MSDIANASPEKIAEEVVKTYSAAEIASDPEGIVKRYMGQQGYKSDWYAVYKLVARGIGNADPRATISTPEARAEAGKAMFGNATGTVSEAIAYMDKNYPEVSQESKPEQLRCLIGGLQAEFGMDESTARTLAENYLRKK